MGSAISGPGSAIGEPVTKFNLFLTGSFSHLCSASRLTEFRAAQIQCFYRIAIAKIALVLCNFKNPFVDGRLRLPDYIQCKMRFCAQLFFNCVALDML